MLSHRICSFLNPVNLFQEAGSYTSHLSMMWHISLKAPYLLCLVLASTECGREVSVTSSSHVHKAGGWDDWKQLVPTSYLEYHQVPWCSLGFQYRNQEAPVVLGSPWLIRRAVSVTVCPVQLESLSEMPQKSVEVTSVRGTYNEGEWDPPEDRLYLLMWFTS